jgi:tRNA-specific 2-thiouridylase
MIENFSADRPSTIVVGMSGGVDSSVTAAILKEQGHNVIGLFMRNWEEKDEHGVCQSAKDWQDVIKVCEQLDISHYSIDFVKEYQENVFSHFLEEYRAGHTPNPDILCNREIKFKVFFEHAMKLGADYLATGHYCQNRVVADNYFLAKGIDRNKDQSYFLHAISGEVLPKVIFPLGHLEKSKVRDLAEKYKLATSKKKDSTGICFIGERNFPEFLSQYIKPRKGKFLDLSGNVQGEHQGAHFYTLGQRKGLGLGGQGEPWFVVDKNIDENLVIVERGEMHPALYSDYLTATEETWINSDAPKLPLKLSCKVRYRQKDQQATLSRLDDGRLKVDFDIPQRAVTPRQSVVFYDGEVCLGGAVIESAGPSYYQQKKTLPEIVAI